MRCLSWPLMLIIAVLVIGCGQRPQEEAAMSSSKQVSSVSEDRSEEPSPAEIAKNHFLEIVRRGLGGLSSIEVAKILGEPDELKEGVMIKWVYRKETGGRREELQVFLSKEIRSDNPPKVFQAIWYPAIPVTPSKIIPQDFIKRGPRQITFQTEGDLLWIEFWSPYPGDERYALAEKARSIICRPRGSEWRHRTFSPEKGGYEWEVDWKEMIDTAAVLAYSEGADIALKIDERFKLMYSPARDIRYH